MKELIHVNPIVLVLLGFKRPEVKFGGKWNGFGGKVTEGESIEEAAKRELLEECGLTVNDIEKIAGEWNRVECIADGDKISIFLNGTLVNEAVNVKPSKGRIQIQSEGAEIFFRRVDLTRLK